MYSVPATLKTMLVNDIKGKIEKKGIIQHVKINYHFVPAVSSSNTGYIKREVVFYILEKRRKKKTRRE